ncbi:hypothetical protein QFZ54_003791 [Sphingomonas faeni]|nr:hypothetical protein [Sphingomonas faeni]
MPGAAESIDTVLRLFRPPELLRIRNVVDLTQ